MFTRLAGQAHAKALVNAERAVRARSTAGHARLAVADLISREAQWDVVEREEEWADTQDACADWFHKRSVLWMRVAAILGGDSRPARPEYLGDSPVTAAARAIMEAERRRAAKR